MRQEQVENRENSPIIENQKPLKKDNSPWPGREVATTAEVIARLEEVMILGTCDIYIGKPEDRNII